MKKGIVTVIILILILGGAGFLISKNGNRTATENYGTDDKVSSNQVDFDLCPVTPGLSATMNDGKYWHDPDYTLPDEYKGKKAVVKTNYGTFTVSFLDNQAPIAVENFIRLANDKKYNGSIFHRIIKGFMIQGGDYTRGDGRGGESVWGESFVDQLGTDGPDYPGGYKRGVVAMANAGANTNGSQFFVMHADYPLPNCYTIFGKVTEGIDVIDKIANVPVLEGMFEASTPTTKINLEQVTIENR